MAPVLPAQPMDSERVNDKAKYSATVLVTGFRPFQEEYPINPSWEIARTLPKEIANYDSSRKPIKIITCEEPLLVSYAVAKKTIPELLNAHADDIDLVINMGMAPGDDYYCIERYGRRSGYVTNRDLDGNVPDPHEPENDFADCPDVMTTSLNFESVLEKWQDLAEDAVRDTPFEGVSCRPSNDAGRFLCDYTYFNSLAWFGRRNHAMQAGSATSRPVLFLHVPGESDTADLDRGRAVTIALIKAMELSLASSKQITHHG